MVHQDWVQQVGVRGKLGVRVLAHGYVRVLDGSDFLRFGFKLWLRGFGSMGKPFEIRISVEGFRRLMIIGTEGLGFGI